MSEKQNDGGPAFPTIHGYVDSFGSIKQKTNGLSVRDYFAAHALTGLLAADARYGGRTDDRESLVLDAYQTADAMIKAREA